MKREREKKNKQISTEEKSTTVWLEPRKPVRLALNCNFSFRERARLNNATRTTFFVFIRKHTKQSDIAFSLLFQPIQVQRLINNAIAYGKSIYFGFHNYFGNIMFVYYFYDLSILCIFSTHIRLFSIHTGFCYAMNREKKSVYFFFAFQVKKSILNFKYCRNQVVDLNHLIVVMISTELVHKIQFIKNFH